MHVLRNCLKKAFCCSVKNWWLIIIIIFIFFDIVTTLPDLNLDVGFCIVAIRTFKKAETSSSNLNLRLHAWTRLNGRYYWRSVSVYPQILSPSARVAWWTCLSIRWALLVLSLSSRAVRSGPRGYSGLVLLGWCNVLLGRPRRYLMHWCEGQPGSDKDE